MQFLLHYTHSTPEASAPVRPFLLVYIYHVTHHDIDKLRVYSSNALASKI